MLRIVPAQQGFDARGSACAQADLRLVMKQEFPVIQRDAQPLLHADAPCQFRIHFDAVMQVSFARGLGLLEGGFRVLHQFV